MDRTFHSKVDWWYWLLMAVTAFLLFDFFWFHYTIATLLVAAVMIFEIEMLIHTRYIVTGSGKLLIETGRFVADKTILLNTIVSMCEVNSFSIAPADFHIYFGGYMQNDRVVTGICMMSVFEPV